MAAGLPDGAPRPPPRAADFDAIRKALAAIDPAALDDVQATVLLAWIKAWSQHWPERFAAEIGADAGRLMSALVARNIDENRYLKLRRIALENLAAFL